MGKNIELLVNGSYDCLKKYTGARIAIGHTGGSIPLQEMLKFRLSHAHARDEVFSTLDENDLIAKLDTLQPGVLLVESMARDKSVYIRRPDFGRRLCPESINLLNNVSSLACEISISIADGLSASAVNNHAEPLLKYLIPGLKQLKFSLAPLTVVNHGRVAIADEIAGLLNAQLSIILIGERPGLSSADSLGVYITYQWKQSLTDESRNCVSNISAKGLSYEAASQKILYLVQEAFKRKGSGVALKENSEGSTTEKGYYLSDKSSGFLFWLLEA